MGVIEYDLNTTENFSTVIGNRINNNWYCERLATIGNYKEQRISTGYIGIIPKHKIDNSLIVLVSSNYIMCDIGYVSNYKFNSDYILGALIDTEKYTRFIFEILKPFPVYNDPRIGIDIALINFI
jgi:hypothetical protein